MASNAWHIVPGNLTDERVVALLRHHVAAAMADMPRESCHALDVAGLRQPNIHLWAIWDGDELAGVGALRDIGDGTGEVKSMHTAGAMRGRGVGSAMVRHLIAAARVQGLHRLFLETGAIDYFASARALYARHGFTECGPYHGYRSDPNSVFMTRDLAVGDAAST